MYAFWHAIAATPWWQYLIFYFLVQIGFAATKPRLLTPDHLLVAPVLFLSLYLFSMYYLINWHIKYVGLFLALYLIGIMIGWIQFKLLKIKAVAGSRQLYIPGTWTVIVVMVSIIIIKYYFGLEFNFYLFQQENYASTLVMLCGLLNGVTFGHLLYAIKCIQAGPYHESLPRLQ